MIAQHSNSAFPVSLSFLQINLLSFVVSSLYMNLREWRKKLIRAEWLEGILAIVHWINLKGMPWNNNAICIFIPDQTPLANHQLKEFQFKIELNN